MRSIGIFLRTQDGYNGEAERAQIRAMLRLSSERFHDLPLRQTYSALLENAGTFLTRCLELGPTPSSDSNHDLMVSYFVPRSVENKATCCPPERNVEPRGLYCRLGLATLW